MLSGVGQLGMVTKSLGATSFGQNVFFPGQFVEFNFELTADEKKARAWVAGRKKVVSSAPGDEDNSLKIAFEYLDWFHLAFGLDEMPSTLASVWLPVWKEAIVPADGIISEPEILADNANDILPYVNVRGPWGDARPLIRATTSPVAANDFMVDVAEKEIQIHTDFAGASITYQVLTAHSNIPSLGVAAEVVSFGKLGFWGRGYGPEFPNGILINLPDITRSGGPPAIVTDDVPKFELSFTANTPPGSRTPYRYYNLQ